MGRLRPSCGADRPGPCMIAATPARMTTESRPRPGTTCRAARTGSVKRVRACAGRMNADSTALMTSAPSNGRTARSKNRHTLRRARMMTTPIATIAIVAKSSG